MNERVAREIRLARRRDPKLAMMVAKEYPTASHRRRGQLRRQLRIARSTP